MSSKIYFQDSAKLRRFFVGQFSKFLHSLTPKLALKFAAKMLLTPERQVSNWQDGIRRGSVNSHFGKLVTYELGPKEGPLILFVHGWSGSAFQFSPLMILLANQGYRVLAYDQPAHGESAGKHASLPKFIRCFEQLIKNIPKPSKVVAHSMGASAVANSEWCKSFTGELIFVAPMVQPLTLLRQTIKASGFDQNLFDAFFVTLMEQFEMNEGDVDVYQSLQCFSGSLKILHDEFDRFAPFIHSQKLADCINSELIATQKLGHGRILNSVELQQLLSA